MWKRFNKQIAIGVFGNFLPLGAHILLDYLFEDEETEGFIYKRNPTLKDFQILDKIICSVDVYKKFETELTKLSKKKKITVVYEHDVSAEIDGINKLYICHSDQTLINAEHKSILKKPGASGFRKK